MSPPPLLLKPGELGGVGVPDRDSARDFIIIPTEGSGVTLLDLVGRLPVVDAVLDGVGVVAALGVRAPAEAGDGSLAL